MSHISMTIYIDEPAPWTRKSHIKYTLNQIITFYNFMFKVTHYKNCQPLLQASGMYFMFVTLMKSKIPLREYEEL